VTWRPASTKAALHLDRSIRFEEPDAVPQWRGEYTDYRLSALSQTVCLIRTFSERLVPAESVEK